MSRVLRQAGESDLMHVLIEGGSQVAASALHQGLVDRVAVFIAPKILGRGIPAVGDLGLETVAHAVRLVDIATERLGDDLLYTANLRPPEVE